MRTLITKKNNIMAFVQIEDLYGEIELVVFPTYTNVTGFTEEDRCCQRSCKLQGRGAPKILADKIRHRRIWSGKGQPVKIRIPDSMDEEAALHDIKNLLCHYPGDCPFCLWRRREGATRWIRSCGWILPRFAVNLRRSSARRI